MMKYVINIFIFIQLSLCCHTVVSDAFVSEKIEIDIQTITENINNLRKIQGQVNKRYSDAELQLKTVENDIVNVQESIDVINDSINNLQIEIKRLEQDINKLTKEKKELLLQMRNIAISFYMLNEDLGFRGMFNMDYFYNILDYLDYLELIQEKTIKVTDSHMQALISIQKVEKDHKKQEDYLKKERITLQNRKKQLEKHRKNRYAWIEKIAVKKEKSVRMISEMEKQRKELEVQLSKLRKSRILSSSLTELRGRLPWPAKGKILFKFNDIDTKSKMQYQGIFIQAPLGREVNAVYDGSVIFADWLRGYGQLVIVDHGDDYLTLYAHNSLILKREGEHVLAGEILAKSGDTGGITSSGVYFELRYRGIPVDPQLWLVLR